MGPGRRRRKRYGERKDGREEGEGRWGKEEMEREVRRKGREGGGEWNLWECRDGNYPSSLCRSKLL